MIEFMSYIEGFFKFQRQTGKGDEKTDEWIAYCAFHLADFKKALDVSPHLI